MGVCRSKSRLQKSLFSFFISCYSQKLQVLGFFEVGFFLRRQAVNSVCDICESFIFCSYFKQLFSFQTTSGEKQRPWRRKKREIKCMCMLKKKLLTVMINNKRPKMAVINTRVFHFLIYLAKTKRKLCPDEISFTITWRWMINHYFHYH